MNIHTAAIYLKQGYRIRRPEWHQSEYVTLMNGALYSWEHEHHGHSFGFWSVGPEDLLADDFEIITKNIVTHYPVTYGDITYSDERWD